VLGEALIVLHEAVDRRIVEGGRRIAALA